MIRHVVKGNRVLVYPGVKSILAVDLIQLINFEATVLLTHRSSQAGYPSVFADNILSFIIHRGVLVTLEQVPDNPQVSRHGISVRESARNEYTRASHAGDTVRGGEVPPTGEYVSCQKKKKQTTEVMSQITTMLSLLCYSIHFLCAIIQSSYLTALLQNVADIVGFVVIL